MPNEFESNSAEKKTLEAPVRVYPQTPDSSQTPHPKRIPSPDPLEVPRSCQIEPIQEEDPSVANLSEEECTERKREKRYRILIEIFDTIKIFCVVLILYLLLNQFVFQINSVSGPSMQPNLHTGDRIVVNLISKSLGAEFDHSSIITIHGDQLRIPVSDIIKRVIGKPGDTIEIREDGVFRNGEKIEEPYLGPGVKTEPKNRGFDTVTLGPDQYYVLGDNRSNSTDSRDLGPIPRSAIMGELLFRFYPFSDFGSVH